VSLANGVTYYWSIAATDGMSASTGPVWRFTTVRECLVYLPVVLRQF
jgi:hypothetical protein